MKLIKDFDELSEKCSIGVTIGNFDGVHIGHKMLLKSIMDDCKRKKLELVVITFTPHPHQILSPSENFIISNDTGRRKLLDSIGVDYLYEIDFTRDLSTLPPGDFFDHYVFHHAHIKSLYLGHDFAFGANKTGNFSFAKNYCSERGIELKIEKEYKYDEKIVSSTIVRQYIKDGDVEFASKLLGREHFITGRVVKGVGRGKLIGFPTANLSYSKELLVPQNGVYISKVLYMGENYEAITNVGMNPTFCDDRKINIETYILDFDKMIYGESITVSFVKKIRNEKKFSMTNDLIGQIEKDIIIVRTYFENENKS